MLSSGEPGARGYDRDDLQRRRRGHLGDRPGRHITSYAYDGGGNQTQVTDPGDGRLTAVTNGAGATVSYSYDSTGPASGSCAARRSSHSQTADHAVACPLRPATVGPANAIHAVRLIA
jgi:hypothetical protein